MRAVALLLKRGHFELIRRPVLIAGGAIALAAVAWGLVRWNGQRIAAEHLQATQQRDAVNAELAQARASQQDLEQNLDRYRALAATGFLGEGDRLAWTEALVAQQRALGLPPVQFELAPRRPLAAGAAEAAGSDAGPEADAGATAPGPQAHDLHFAIEAVHEGELLALIERLRALGIGHFRVQDCLLRRSAAHAALDTACTLRWVTYLPAPATPAEPAAGATP